MKVHLKVNLQLDDLGVSLNSCVENVTDQGSSEISKKSPVFVILMGRLFTFLTLFKIMLLCADVTSPEGRLKD